MIELPNLMTEDDVATYLGVHRETVARERRARRIAHHKVARKIRYTLANVMDYLEATKCTTTSGRAVVSGTSAGPAPMDAHTAHLLACEIAPKRRKASPDMSSPTTDRLSRTHDS
jgi:excisionase family DNA binding protein